MRGVLHWLEKHLAELIAAAIILGLLVFVLWYHDYSRPTCPEGYVAKYVVNTWVCSVAPVSP